MPAFLTWVDHDPADRDRMRRILALFEERDTRDELGLGAIRDTLADRFFPGTSTVQTRLRYMLFVPWVYRRLETERVPSARAAERARQWEEEMVAPLADSGALGIFGRNRGGGIKRLPSSVYWAGLESWGVRRFPGSQEEYFAALDGLHRRRRAAAHREEGELSPAGPVETWHPQLPPPPPGFPAGITPRLTVDEADFLRDRILAEHPASLLAHLVRTGASAEAETPWEHPDHAGFSEAHRELLTHARLFADAARGAALLYNLMLAERKKDATLVSHYHEALEAWAASVDPAAYAAWDLGRFRERLLPSAHSITPQARAFLTAWVTRLQAGPAAVATDVQSRDMVRRREELLKGGRSRFRNDKALAQWGGAAGTRPLEFRWATARSFLRDLKEAGGSGA